MGGGVSRFSVENVMSHSAENFRRGILYCCIISRLRKSLDRMGGEYQDFPFKNLCLTVRKFFIEVSFTVSLILGIEKVWISVGEYHYFLSKFFRLTVPKISVGESFTVALFSGSEKVWIGWGGVSRFSVEIFTSHRADKPRRGVIYCCITFGY